MSGITEADAKTKWCPFVRSSVVGTNAENKLMVISNRDAAQLVEHSDKDVFTHNCIGSACMAWRWKHPGFDHNIIGEPITPVEAEGFCGLAGRP